MLVVFQSSVTPMLMMFTCITIGYILNKLDLLPENSDAVLAKAETYAFVPALNIYTFMTYCTVESLVSYRSLILVASVLIAAAVAVSYPLSSFFSKDGYQRNIYKYALAFGNYGFLGNAIVPMIMGEEFLYPYLLFALPLSVVCHVWGLSVLIPGNHGGGSAFKKLLNPPVISIGIGMILGLCRAQEIIPSFLKLALENLKLCMGPVAMLLTGFVVAKYGFLDLLKKPPVYVATLFRLILLPVFFLTPLYLLGVDDLAVSMCFFAFATPLGLNTVVFPSAYGEDSSTGASMAIISHTLSVITIPLLYSVLSSFITI